LPALTDAATVVLDTSLPQAEPKQGVLPEAPAPVTREHVDGHHSLAFNFDRPGHASVRIGSHGRFSLRVVGPGAGKPLDLEAPALSEVSLPAGPASIIVEANEGADAEVGLAVTGAKLLARGVSSPRSHSWFRLSGAVAQEFLLDGTDPVRLSVRRMAPGESATINWRLLRGKRELAHGSVAVAEGIDRFTTLDGGNTPGPVGTQVQSTLRPEGADVLELTSRVESLVRVETWIEAGADPRPVEPFVDAPAGYRWLGVPARAPHWLALRPHGPASEAQVAHLNQSPHLLSLPARPAGPSSFVTLRPTNVHSIELFERTRHAAQHPTTLLRVPSDTSLWIAEAGARARQVSATCNANGKPGGEISLSIDGIVRAHARMTLSTVQLRAAADVGERRVRLAGSSAYCLVDARPSHGDIGAHRTAYEIAPDGGLQVAIDVAQQVRPVYIAVYRQEVGAGRLTVKLDDGHPLRHPGEYQRATIAEAVRDLEPSAVQAVRLPNADSLHRSIVKVVLGDDLVAGRHILALTYSGSDRAWARLWTAGHHARRERVKLWTAEEPSE
jgi:hypothetical protein